MDRTRKPTFWWQGVLILLPMFGLTLVGLFSLWRDQVNSHREADERARREAAQIVTNIVTQFHPFPAHAVSSSAGSNLVKIDLAGETYRFHNADGQARSLFGVNTPGGEQTYRFSQGESWVSTPLDKPLEDPVYRVAAGTQNLRFCVLDERGNLSYPPPMDETPQPATDPQALAGDQKTLWLQAGNLEATDPKAALLAYADFLAGTPSADFAALARYRSGLLLVRTGDHPAAEPFFSLVATQHPQALSESGLPLQVLARYQLAALRLADTNSAGSGQSLVTLAATAVLKPSALSVPVLDQVKMWATQARLSEAENRAIEGWMKVWASHQSSRKVWLGRHGAGRTNWAETSSGRWLASETAPPTAGCKLLLARPADEVQKELSQILGSAPCPEYFALRATLVEGAAVVFRHAGTNASNGPEMALASAETAFPGDPKASLLRVDCILDRPELLYAAQTRRMMIFAVFLGVAAITAAAGFINARRAFHRQLQVNEMKSNFVSAVSHELRAPIASVRLMAEGLDRGKIAEPARQKEYFHFIVQECRRLTSLIENVLDFSRIEQGRKNYEFEPTDLVALVQQTTNLMRANAAERQVCIDLRCPCGPFPQPTCDGLALQQALVNLIDNALKHSPPHSTIVVALAAGSDGEQGVGSTLALSVEDQGPGIPPEEHEKIFERFYRRGSELRRETQGVGIGLTIVKHIVEAHGGRIRLRSAVGQGSCFTIELPVRNS